jgi:imidazolonepropionase-like amidohydrolase
VTKFICAPVLFDGTGNVTSNACLVIDGERIVSVEQRLPSSLPAGAEVLSFETGFLMPGFIDAHNHLGLRSPGSDEAQMADDLSVITERAKENARIDLECGITTMRELGERDYLDLTFKKEIESGNWAGPRLITSGPWITPTHGHGSWEFGADIADGPLEVTKAVRRHVKAGCDAVKLMVSGGLADRGKSGGSLGTSYYTFDEIRAGVSEAHNLGLRVAIHCYGGPGVMMSVEAGVDTIEHAARITSPAELDTIAERGVSLVYTAGTLYKYPQVRETSPAAQKAALAAGASIGFGADTVHGKFAYEAEVAVGYGMTSKQALVAMTSGSARACGWLDRVGTLESGKLADITVVDGNPLDEILALGKILAVFKGGALVVNNRVPVTA